MQHPDPIVPESLNRAEARIREAMADIEAYQRRQVPTKPFIEIPPPKHAGAEALVDIVFAIGLGLIGGVLLSRMF